ncbi:MAG: sodium:proton antiporter NhaD, partial [Porticoccaceae bacterium]|nr:sodium:proton antiporter NhaD [Porticoccaceae bacterium]
MKILITLIAGLLLPGFAIASGEAPEPLGLTDHWVGYASIVIFAIAYTFVIFEEQIHLRKSKPVLVAAGIIWILIAAYCYYGIGDHHLAATAIRHNFLEYAELFFFLLVAMTYINAMMERSVFD